MRTMPYLPRLFGRPACFPHLLSPSLHVVSAPRAGLRPARPPRGSRKLGAARRFLVTLALLALAGCGERAASSGASAKGAKPPEVGVVEVKTRDVPLELDLPGRLSASQIAEVRPQVGGIVLQRLFTEGSRVKAGQPLYQLDAAAFTAERDRAAAALQKAEAQVAAARTKSERDAALLRADAISREAAEDSATALRQAQADVAIARATLDAARLQLERARIVAPIGGRIEVSNVTAGALVTANQTAPLTTIVQTDPMHVNIVQSSTELLMLRRQLQGDAQAPSRSAQAVRLILEDGSVHPEPATLQFSGVTVDRGTGAVTLRATVPNPAGTLLPGMVVTARLTAGTDQGAITVPQQGVSRSPTGEATALVIGAENKLERRRLKLGRAVGNEWLVTDGLKPGDRLVVEGLQRVRPGQVVTPVAASPVATAPGGAR